MRFWIVLLTTLETCELAFMDGLETYGTYDFVR